ncbi:AraC family transcriptional regulator [Subtercola boreus]|nr:AraC family transcriptional regulator [Subtercola boreus]
MGVALHFATRDVHATERVALWEQHNARALLSLQCRTLDDEPLDATEANVDLGSLSCARVTATPHVVERTAREIRTSETDGLALYFTLRGESFFYQRDGVHVLRPGTLLICDVNQPFMRGFAGGLEELVLRVPRRLLDTLGGGGPVGRGPATMDFSSRATARPTAHTLAALVSSAMRTQTVDVSGRAAPDAVGSAAVGPAADVEQRAIDLLRSILANDDLHGLAAVRSAAQAALGRRLRDPRVSVRHIADDIGVSERQLSRAFAETGTGPARVLLELRLELADRTLRDPASTLSTVGEVAAACGFSSHSHFTRVYRDRFGMTPAQVRATRADPR